MEKFSIQEILRKHNQSFYPVIDFQNKQFKVLDFTEKNKDLDKFDIDDTSAFEKYISGQLNNYEKVGVGGYGEDRIIYRRSSLFDSEKEPRCIHLGIDIWVPEYSPVHAPLDAKIHSFAYNETFGDYGATIILQHELESTVFYTLNGHLSKKSLEGKKEGMRIAKGEVFASVGDPTENGQWPPHLHFQLITDMLGRKGDYFGVAPPSEKERYFELCPDPNLVLNIPELEKK
jgi:murein DD-endopeptidase MepM/ murein hydrolase activator NlpD